MIIVLPFPRAKALLAPPPPLFLPLLRLHVPRLVPLWTACILADRNPLHFHLILMKFASRRAVPRSMKRLPTRMTLKTVRDGLIRPSRRRRLEAPVSSPTPTGLNRFKSLPKGNFQVFQRADQRDSVCRKVTRNFD